MIEYILFGVMFLVITEFVLYLITRKGKWNLSNFVLAKTISIFVGAVVTAIGYTIYDEIGAISVFIIFISFLISLGTMECKERDKGCEDLGAKAMTIGDDNACYWPDGKTSIVKYECERFLYVWATECKVIPLTIGTYQIKMEEN